MIGRNKCKTANERRGLAPLSALPERFAAVPKPAWRVAPSVAEVILRCRGSGSLQWGALLNLKMKQRLSVLLPERSNCCNQRLCAFGGCLVNGDVHGQISPDGWGFYLQALQALALRRRQRPCRSGRSREIVQGIVSPCLQKLTIKSACNPYGIRIPCYIYFVLSRSMVTSNRLLTASSLI